jgi:exopolysaccharide biosynthesis polyprenyl glycosylphosphotransferase
MTTSRTENVSRNIVVPTPRATPRTPRGVEQDGFRPRTRKHKSSSGSISSLRLLALGIDIVAVAVVLTLAGLGRARLGIFAPALVDFMPGVAAATPVIAVFWAIVIALMGGYERQVFGAGTDEYRRVVNASLLTVAVIGIGCFMLQFELSRGFYVLVLILGPTVLLLGRVALRLALKRARTRGLLSQKVLIVGSDAHIDEVATVLQRESWLGYHVLGALTPGGHQEISTTTGVPILGSASEVATTAHNLNADVVFFAGGAVSSAAQLRQTAWELEHSSCQVVVAPSLTDVSRERVRVRPVGGLPLLHLEKPRTAAAGRKAKRTFDLIGSFTLLVLLSPVLLVAAIQVWRHDRGPVFFSQQRIGRDGVTFDCWKFRTMVTDAESRLAQLHDELGLERGIFVKIKGDPRITPPGRWLRRFSLDELPQLLNVLRGDMSLVGPRPQVAHEVALYDRVMARRLQVRPGMTGLWQVSGRSDLSLEEAIRLDLYYVDNWSMIQDLNILLRTFRAVFGSSGAY